MPRVSYVLATYNRASFLRKTLLNLRDFVDPAQDELLVIDGGSTDETRELLEENRDLISNIVSERDKGEAHAFNKGLLNATGDIVKFLTDDDVYRPEAVKRTVKLLLENPGLDAVVCGGRFLNGEPGSSDVRSYQHVPDGIVYASSILNVFDYAGCGIGLWCRRSTLALVGLLDTSFKSVDADYLTRMIERGANIAFFRIHLFDHHSHLGSGVVTGIQQIRRDHVRILLRNGKVMRTLKCLAGWHIRPLIPRPLRYLWKLPSSTVPGVSWNDGRVL